MSLLDTASLIVTPNAYKEGKLYSVIPSDGSGDLSVTRATTATRVNAAGLVELVPYNLLQQSQTFESATWGKIRSSITANTTTAPNGTMTADSLFDSIDNNIHYISQTITAISGVATVSIYAKANQLSQIQIAALGGTTPMGRGFDLSNGTTFSETIGGVSSNDLGQSITDMGNGWYRCTMSWTATAQTSVWILTSSGGAATYVGTGTNSVFIWGAQLVEGTEAKDYFATETRLNIPRLDYSLGSCPSILVEPQRTNVLTNSDGDLSTYPSVTSVTDASVPISGFSNSIQFGDNSTLRLAYKRNFIPIIGVEYALSVFVQMDDNSAPDLGISSLTGDFSLIMGTSLGTSNVKVEQINSTNVYRVSATRVAPTLATQFGVIKYTTQSSKTFKITGIQLEAGAYATSYIGPTTTASVTRIADVISKTGISSLIGQTEGTIFLDVNLDTSVDSNSHTLISLSNGTTSNFFLIYKLSSNQISVIIRTGGVQQVTINSSAITTGRYKLAIGYKQDDVVVYMNGIQIGVNTSCTIPSTSVLSLSNIAGLNQSYSKIKSASLWKERFTNAQLAALTTI
jgi:hypothetical protein